VVVCDVDGNVAGVVGDGDVVVVVVAVVVNVDVDVGVGGGSSVEAPVRRIHASTSLEIKGLAILAVTWASRECYIA